MIQVQPAPTVSVIMPVYNVEPYVAEAIQSVLAQKFTDFELIIVDDGGQDGSMAICRGFDDSRIRIVAQANRGLAGARNSGIAAARGRFIALLDSDDRWHVDKLMLHVIHLEANGHVDVSYAGSQMVNHAGEPLTVAMRPQLLGVKPADILRRNPVGNGSAAVIRRSALDLAAFRHPDDASRTCWFDESFRQSEDIELWLRLSAQHGCIFEGIEGLLTDYRIIGGGLSANVVRQFESWERAVAKATVYAPQLIRRHGRAARGYQLRYLARRAVQLADGPFAVSLLCQAVSLYPKMIIFEPRKTLMTIIATAAARLLPEPQFRALLGRRLGDVA